MPKEEVADVKDDTAPGVGAGAGGSSAAAIADPPDEAEHASPDESTSQIAGESDDQSSGEQEVETGSEEDKKQERKSRTARQVERLREKAQTAEERQRTAEAEAQTLKAQLAQSLGSPAQSPSPPDTRQTSETPAGLPTPQAGSQRADFEQLQAQASDLYARYQSAQATGDTAQMHALAQHYNATQAQLETAREERIAQRIESRLKSQQRHQQLADELMQIDSRFPILKRDEKGSRIAQIDPASPLVQAALRYAQADGIPVQKEHLYRAQADFLLAGAMAASAGGNRIRSAAQNLMGRTGLEGAQGTPPPPPARSPLEGASTEQLRAAAAKQARGKK